MVELYCKVTIGYNPKVTSVGLNTGIFDMEGTAIGGKVIKC